MGSKTKRSLHYEAVRLNATFLLVRYIGPLSLAYVSLSRSLVCLLFAVVYAKKVFVHTMLWILWNSVMSANYSPPLSMLSLSLAANAFNFIWHSSPSFLRAAMHNYQRERERVLSTAEDVSRLKFPVSMLGRGEKKERNGSKLRAKWVKVNKAAEQWKLFNKFERSRSVTESGRGSDLSNLWSLNV